MKRNFEIYCDKVSGDGSEFKLVLEIDNRVKEEKKGLWSFDDVLIVLYDFYKTSLEKYDFDGRRDTFDFCVEYSWGR
jgi:hypothetical protein